MGLNVRVEETVCVAGVHAIPQKVAAVTMATTVNAMMNTVRSTRINSVEVRFIFKQSELLQKKEDILH